MPNTPEVILRFNEPIDAEGGALYDARVLGVENPLGTWEGWIEFSPITGGSSISTERETTESKRTDLEYWAGGLTRVFLQGALQRALGTKFGPPPVTPAEMAPGAAPARRDRTPDRVPVSATPVLDPFAVYVQGEEILHRELLALSEDKLRTIVRAYDLAEVPSSLDPLTRAELAASIVAAVKAKALTPRR